MISHYQGSYVRALVDLFPEVHFEKTKFALVPSIIIIIIK